MRARTRLAHLLGAWTLLFLGNPGLPGGPLTATLGLIWLAAASLLPTAPAPRTGWRSWRLWTDWLAAAVGLSAQCFWSTKVLWITLLAVAIVPGVYYAVAAMLARRLVRVGVPLAFASAYTALEIARTQLEPPFAFGWMRTAHYYAELQVAPLRVLGAAGFSFVVLYAAGALAWPWIQREVRPRRALGHAGAALAVLVLAGLVTSPAPTETVGRALLVQPSFEQRRKMEPRSAQELFREPEWARYQLDERDMQTLHENERAVLRLLQTGKTPILAPGTIYLAGAEELRLIDGWVRRTNAVIVWQNGQRLGRGGKLHLVPGAESLAGLERVGLVRDTAFALAGYIPDLAAEPDVAVVDLPLRSGRSVRAALSVCFDNSFEDVYARGTAQGAELHIVVSNEAWYEESFEYDQMIAFSRVAAAETGRALLRATNAGVSALVHPDGRVERLEIDGRDRMVRGTLAVDLPVPVRAAAGELPRTVYSRLRLMWLWGLALAPLALLGYLRWRSR
jgi:apolipoprotein N-acyltransferase